MKMIHARWMYFMFIGSFLAAGAAASPLAAREPVVLERILWKSGEGRYPVCRIPSLIVSAKGTLLAFIEGRSGGSDSGDISLVLKRSTDIGKTWGEDIVVWDDSFNTCGNPCPVVDEDTGRIWLWMTWNYGKDSEKNITRKNSEHSRIPFVCYSDDDGLSWSKPVDMSESGREPSWGWYATGPGIGIQLKTGPHRGRLVIPANHSYDDPDGNLHDGPFGYGAHVLFSDDHGRTWKRSSPIRPGCNESQVAELPDGRLILNMRSYNEKHCRAVSFSSDGGESWSPVEHDVQLVESVCQASLLRYGEYKGKQIYLFSNPAVPVGRTHLTIRVSADGCKTWYVGRLICPGLSSYSCLTRLPDRSIGILFESWKENENETIRFACIDPEAVLDAKDIRVSDL